MTETRYAPSSGGFLAYQTEGSGPFDVVIAGGFPQHLEIQAEQPGFRRLVERIAGFSRVIRFDRRGMGLSDPPTPGDRLEDRAEDVLAVLRAAGSEQASFVSFGEGGLTVLQLAAAHPEVVTSMVLVAPYARLLAADGYDVGLDRAAFAEAVGRTRDLWGSGQWVIETLFPPFAADPVFRQWAARFERYAVSPTLAAEAWQRVGAFDVRHLLSQVTAPALLIGRSDNPGHGRGHVRFLAEHLPDATIRELPGEVVGTFFDADPEEGDEIAEFLVGSRADPAPRRSLQAILFTDIVDSTSRASTLGDARWRALLDHHDAVLGREITRFGGRLVKSTGDGVVAVFSSPSDAVRCALAAGTSLEAVDVGIRAGVHVGEIELRGEDVAGLAVNIAARVAARAGRAEVLVSQTVVDLLIGTAATFEPAGRHELKGVPGLWHLHSLSRPPR